MAKGFSSEEYIKNVNRALIGDIYGSGSKKTRRPIDKNLRSLVWQRYNPNSLTGKCYVCKRPITHDHFEIGHNKAVVKGGKDNISNLRPICRPCNSGMGTMSIEQYKAKYFGGKKPVKNIRKKRSTRKTTRTSYDPTKEQLKRVQDAFKL